MGQEYDAETGLNYLNARYYNSNIGRFISQDPMFWDFSEDYLSDPQQWNSYSYARNNPIVGSDPTGLTINLKSTPVFNPLGQIVGIHTYFQFIPNYPNEINIEGLPKGTKEFTMGAYPSDGKGWSNQLLKQIGIASTDKEYDMANKKIINSIEITPPNGNETEFINNMGKVFNETDLSGMKYYGLGNVHLGNMTLIYDANSNNFTYTLGVKSGVKSQMDSFDPGPGVPKIIGEYGYKNIIPTTSVYREVKNAVNSFKEKVNNFVSSLRNK
ncbi:MAG: RHS repeat-associated core domain-containing protein [Candidatus Staskawiczbacteria bacterium]|nr:RHS repeat-associated core domain-containing protein [Candidatus Staskawiczbacteria bacterium]